MAYLKTIFNTALLSCLFLISISAFTVSSHMFKIGGDRGWAIPLDNQTFSYNNWAGKNRFQIGDTLYFKYQNDSVLVVDRMGYNGCITWNPIAKFEDGKTVFKFDRSGFFYIISGREGHCKSGQKVIIDVMHPFNIEPSEPAPAPQPAGGDSPPPKYNAATKLAVASYYMTALVLWKVFRC